MARLNDWRARLHNLLADYADRAFVPGEFDCSLFTADCIQIITGIDLAAPYRGAYSTVEEGLSLIQADGYADHVALAESHFPIERARLAARTGDIAVVRSRGAAGLGIVIGDRVAVVTERGLGHLPISRVEKVLQV